MIRSLAFLFILSLSFCVVYSQNSSQLLKEGIALRKEGKDPKAIKKIEDALAAAEKEKNIQVQMSCHLELAELKDNVVNYKEALDHYKSFSSLYKKQSLEKTKMLEDSVSGLKTEVDASYAEIESKNSDLQKKNEEIDSLTTEQLQAQLEIQALEIANHQSALKAQEAENRRNLLLFVLGIVVLAAIFVTRGYVLKRRGVRVLRNKNYQIAKEKEKSENLLLNILPKSTAEELKEFGFTKPHSYKIATVMFTDFKGFTSLAEKHTPEELVALVDFYFKAFDKIVAKYGVEKIKTIGDAYMCASGIPEPNPKHASNIIRAAFEFREFVIATAAERQQTKLPYLQMRIGIHSGPLVAGVVGVRKFSYDIWGDAVNIAARMEQSGEVNAINVSESVYNLTKDEFEFTYRGELEAKNKGKLKMYFVNEGHLEKSAVLNQPDSVSQAK